MRRSRVIGACTWMALGHRDARLTLLLGHPSLLAMTIVQNTHLVLKPPFSPHHPLGCLPHCSPILPTTVAVYLYPHLAVTVVTSLVIWNTFDKPHMPTNVRVELGHVLLIMDVLFNYAYFCNVCLITYFAAHGFWIHLYYHTPVCYCCSKFCHIKYIRQTQYANKR